MRSILEIKFCCVIPKDLARRYLYILSLLSDFGSLAAGIGLLREGTPVTMFFSRMGSVLNRRCSMTTSLQGAFLDKFRKGKIWCGLWLKKSTLQVLEMLGLAMCACGAFPPRYAKFQESMSLFLQYYIIALHCEAAVVSVVRKHSDQEWLHRDHPVVRSFLNPTSLVSLWKSVVSHSGAEVPRRHGEELVLVTPRTYSKLFQEGLLQKIPLNFKV